VTNSKVGRYVAADKVTRLDPDAPAYPCGLVAKSLFNDTFEIYDMAGTNLTIDNKDIAWQSDVDNKFKNLDQPDWDKIQWTNVENEGFIVWMRTAGLPNFRKLYGKLNNDLSEGTYTLKIFNNYDVQSFGG